MTVEGLQRRLCSVVSRENGDDPIGSATSYDTYLAIEIPPPWKGDIAQSVYYPSGLWDALVRAFEAGAIDRTTGIMPDPDYSVEGHTRVLMLRRPEGPFSRFYKSEYLLPNDDLVGFVQALTAGESERFEAYLQPTRDVRDVLVCTHGANDACCGKFGYPVYERLRGIAGDSRDLRVWRTSHIGGHRFAATLMDLPEGRCWGHLDAESAERVLRRDVPAVELASKYRGWAGLGSQLEQVAERAILSSEGWGWTGYPKSSRLLDAGESERSELRIEYYGPDGSVLGAYEATVGAAGSVMTLLKSGAEPLQEATQYRVARLEKLPG
jgi:hypothetical protein